MKRFIASSRLLVVLAFIASVHLPARAADWPLFGNDSARSGAVYGDRSISVMNAARMRLRWRTALGDVSDSAPIFLHVRAHGKDRTLLFITSKIGTTYGIDSHDGRILWRFTTHGPNITTSVPAGDPAHSVIYAGGVDGYVHKLDAASGAELRGSGFPVRITLMPETEKNASALNLANGYLYAVTSGYFGDATPYDGHVVTVRLRDGAANVFNTLCANDRSLPTASSCPQNRSGIWSRAGLVVDPDSAMHGQVYIATGNGDFNAHGGGHDYGDSVIALNADGTKVTGYYAPQSYSELEGGDVDLGSTSPAVLPREQRSRTPLMLVQGGKDSILRLLNRSRLPGVGGELQRVDMGSQLYSAPAVWSDSAKRTWIFVGLSGGVRAYRLETDARGESKLIRVWSADAGQTEEGTSPAVTNGVLFVAMDGAIVALEANSGKQLWSSASAGSRGSIGSVHWQSPIVAEGSVYCADQNGNLSAYGVP